MSRPQRRLGDVCDITMGQAPDGSSYNTDGVGLPLVAGAGDLGDLIPGPSKFTTAASKTSRQGDIILCIRATIGDTNWSDRAYCLGRGVAGLRAKSRVLDQRFLWHFIGARRAELEARGTGSTFKQVSRADIADWLIPTPTLAEQQQIAGTLDKADSLRRKRQEAIRLADEFLKAMFIDLFGDPVTNSQHWPTQRLASLGTLDRGVSKHRPRNDPSLLGGDYPLIQTGDVANCDGYVRAFTSTYSEKGLKQSKLWPSGTLCITIAANIAKTGILLFPACFPDSVVGFNAADRPTVEYVRFWFSFLQQTLEANAPASAQKNINLALLRELQIPVPPRDRIERFAAAIDKVEAIRKAQKLALDEGRKLHRVLEQSLLAA